MLRRPMDKQGSLPKNSRGIKLKTLQYAQQHEWLRPNVCFRTFFETFLECSAGSLPAIQEFGSGFFTRNMKGQSTWEPSARNHCHAQRIAPHKLCTRPRNHNRTKVALSQGRSASGHQNSLRIAKFVPRFLSKPTVYLIYGRSPGPAGISLRAESNF